MFCEVPAPPPGNKVPTALPTPCSVSFLRTPAHFPRSHHHLIYLATPVSGGTESLRISSVLGKGQHQYPVATRGTLWGSPVPGSSHLPAWPLGLLLRNHHLGKGYVGKSSWAGIPAPAVPPAAGGRGDAEIKEPWRLPKEGAEGLALRNGERENGPKNAVIVSNTLAK